MRETLEDLYYGNITPYDCQICSGTSLMKVMEQSQECEEQLTKLLEGKTHSLLLRLINAENEIGSTARGSSSSRSTVSWATGCAV